MTVRLLKQSANYRHAAHGAAERCGTCAMFKPYGACTIVAGTIVRNDVCDRYVVKR